MDILAGLNPQQRKAVQHGPGPALVLAGAGSGKTRVITHRIAYLIHNSAAGPENILAVTFTNKAAREMQERVQQILGSAPGAQPLISTFHSFCVRLLRKEIHHLGYKRDFSIYDTDDQRRLMKQILEDDNELHSKFSPQEVLSRISYAKNHGVTPDQYAARFQFGAAEEVAKIYAKYNQRLRQLNALDFDDLLLMAVAVLHQVPESRRFYSDWYRYILVDEYQDTNWPQYELLRLLTVTHTNLFVVGDEDQSIYKFRGANVQNILRFEKDFPGAQIYKLEQNYRSTANILRVAGAVVENNIERKGKILWTANARGHVVTCHCAYAPRDEAAWVTSRIKEALKENPDERIAILYRANFLSRNFEDLLNEEGIPYAIVGSVAFFGRMEVKDLLAYLRIIFNPEDDVALLRIINTPPRGIGPATVDLITEAALAKGVPMLEAARALVHTAKPAGRPLKTLGGFLQLVDKWCALREKLSLPELLETVLKDTQYQEMLRLHETADEAESRIANIEELIRAAAESQSRGESLTEFLDRASLASELDHLDPDARVILMTLHSAKGLEFDTVFLVAMEEGLFPHIQSLGCREDLEEERRLCYVGITRAKKKLYLTRSLFRKNYGPDAGLPSRPSRFLSEMPPELLEGWDAEDLDFSPSIKSPEYRISNTSGAHREAAEVDSGPPASLRAAAPQPRTIAELRAYLEEHKQKSAATKEKNAADPILEPGMRVHHEQFGDGIVLSRQRVGNEVKLVVTFSRAGKKSLIERYAKLKVL